jgi:hypothetical protein
MLHVLQGQFRTDALMFVRRFVMNWMKILVISSCIILITPNGIVNANLLTLSAKPESITKPAGIDLDVTYIRRTPLYNRYQVVWQDEVQTLVPGTEDDKRWPDYGETVTFTAYFKNKGTVVSGNFQYRWSIDGAEVGSGTYTSLDPGGEGMTTHNWPWDHTVVNEQLQRQHTIAFTVDYCQAL